MEISVLGAVRLVGAEAPSSLGAKQRRLLAALTIRAGETLPADVLIDAVWGARPPVSATKLLQVYVSQLRKLLRPPLAIRTRDGGYLLELGDGALDAVRFERLLAEARVAAVDHNHALAASILGRALGLWRGPAYGELAYEQSARAEAERLEELRLVAREEQIEAQLALGRHAELLPELASLAHAEPLRERLQAQFMLALYRCGRQSEALEVYATMHARLREDLGLDPGVELRELQRLILTQNPSLAIAPASGPTASSLPAAPNVLLGRERELEELRELLLRTDVRLLVLTGAGGSGKTRLALEAARLTAGSFANGAVFVALASLKDPQLVLEAIGQALGVQAAAGAALPALNAALRSRELLLVLDNFEHMRAAGPSLVELLAAAPRLTVLVTSRAVLHLSGEHVFPVQPLAIDAAVALFGARARDLDPGFTRDPAGEPVIPQICARLDRLPLAIELAAARTTVLTPTQLLARLDRRLPLLTGGLHDLPARQQTLRATLEWSHDLLSEPEQRLFRRLAVFAGGFGLTAVEKVCDGELDTLAALFAQSLVRRDNDGRLGMLETIREFARERLGASGEAPGIRKRHALYFRDIALSANLREDADGEQRHDLVISDQEDIRVALGWALENGRIELGLEVVVALESFWWTTAAPEGRRWFKALLSHTSANQIPPALYARALRAHGTTTVFAGDVAGAEALYRQSLDMYRQLGDERGAAGVLHCLAANAGDRGDIATARELIEQSLEIHRRVGNKTEHAVALKIMGKVECDEGNYDTGIQLLERAATLAGEAGARFEHAYCLGELCERAFESGRTTDTEAWGRRSLALCQTVGDRQTQLFVLTLLALTALQNGRLRQAGVLWGAVEAGENEAPRGWWTLGSENDRYARARYITPLLAERDPEFEHGRDEGRRLSLDDTIRLVVTPATQGTPSRERPSVLEAGRA